MKKINRKIVCISMLIVIMSLFVSCSNDKKVDDKIHFFNDKLYYNHEGMGEKISFMINYAFYDECPKIELVELQGEGLDNVTWVLGDISEDVFFTNKYNGYHLGTFYIDVDVSDLQNGESISVENIIIECNGGKRNINLSENLIFVKRNFEEECYRLPIQPIQCASGMPTSDIEYPVVYVFEVTEDFILNDIDTIGLIDIEELNIFVNDVEVNKENEKFILPLRKNEQLKLKVKFSLDDAKKNANINTDVIISGINMEEKNVKRHFSLFLLGLYDEKDANNLTKNIGN